MRNVETSSEVDTLLQRAQAEASARQVDNAEVSAVQLPITEAVSQSSSSQQIPLAQGTEQTQDVESSVHESDVHDSGGRDLSISVHESGNLDMPMGMAEGQRSVEATARNEESDYEASTPKRARVVPSPAESSTLAASPAVVRPRTEMEDQDIAGESEPPWRRRRRELDERELVPIFRGASSLMQSPQTPTPRHFVGSVETQKSSIKSKDQALQQQCMKGIVKPEALQPPLAKLFMEGSRLKEAKVVQASMEPIFDQQEAERIMTTVPERVIFSRWLDTWKAVDELEASQPKDHQEAGVPPQLVAKSRLILQGFTDPDHEVMDCEVPTAEVGDITMMCQLLASHGCVATVADIKGAFNQAHSGLRAEPLYVLLPDSDPLWPGVRLAKLVKELYGLLPGPASWRHTLLSELKKLGFIKHGNCPCLMCFPEQMCMDDEGRYCQSRSESGEGVVEPVHTMGGWVLIQTDDLLMGGNGKAFQQALAKLQQTFCFGKWQQLMSTTCTFNGRQLSQTEDYGFNYDMTNFVKKVLPIELNKGRKKGDACTTEEVASFRKLLGALLWAARGGLPQILGDLSLLANRINTLTVEALMLLNKTLKRAQELAAPIRVHPITPRQLIWITWSDASLANQEGHTTQIAFIVGVTSRSILTNGKSPSSILHFASKKMKRVASSTLMTEACALTACLSELEWWLEWWHSANQPTYRACAALDNKTIREIHTSPIDRRLKKEEEIQ
eukprot:6478433-Amphidinium_carterae.1